MVQVNVPAVLSGCFRSVRQVYKNRNDFKVTTVPGALALIVFQLFLIVPFKLPSVHLNLSRYCCMFELAAKTSLMDPVTTSRWQKPNPSSALQHSPSAEAAPRDHSVPTNCMYLYLSGSPRPKIHDFLLWHFGELSEGTNAGHRSFSERRPLLRWQR